jgi:hypothetical protein
MSATEEAYSGEEATEDATEQQEEDATTVSVSLALPTL